MGMVVCFVKIHIRPYMDDIFTLIRVSNCFNPISKHSLCSPSLFSFELGWQLRTLNCTQLCFLLSSLEVMCLGPLHEVLPHVTQQYALCVVRYLTRLKKLWVRENKKLCIFRDVLFTLPFIVTHCSPSNCSTACGSNVRFHSRYSNNI